MFSLFRAILDRVKALFTLGAAQELEAELQLRDAGRKAELLRQAVKYEKEGLHGIAQHLRQQADSLSFQKPLVSVLSALEHLRSKPTSAPMLPMSLNTEGETSPSSPKALPTPTSKKKGR